MRNLLTKSLYALMVTVLFLGTTGDCWAQNKKKKKKVKEKVSQAIDKASDAAAEQQPTIDTSEADALLKEDADLWGPDSLETIKNYSLYREFFKQKSYQDALPYWRYVYKNAPKARKTPLLNGEAMYKSLLDDQIVGMICKDGSEKEGSDKNACKEFGNLKQWKFSSDAKAAAYLDTINQIYDTRVEYFGEEGKLTSKRSRLLAKYHPEKADEVFALRAKAVEQEAEDADWDILYYYFRTNLVKLKNKEIEKTAMIDIYDKVMEVVNHNIDNHEDPKKVEKYEKYGGKMDSSMERLLDAYQSAEEAAATDCPTIKKVYGEKYRANPEDLATVKKLYAKLKRSGCTSDPMYMEALLKLNTLDPTASRTRLIGIAYQKQKDYAQAKNFYNKSIELESDASKNASIYLKLAKIEQVTGSYSAARKYAQQAAQMRAGWGAPYMLIGNLYASSASKVSGDGFGGRSVFWVAVDMYAKAKEIDPDVARDAQQKINKYAASFPDSETVFMKGLSGRYTVGGWIQQSTRVR